MKRVLLTTLFATLLGCLVMGVLTLFETPGMALYVAILGFGNIVIPTLIGVTLFQIIRNTVNFISEVKTLVLRILVLILVFASALILWSIGDVIFSDFSLKNVIDDFNSQFLGFTPIALCLAIAIPAIDILIGDKPVSNDNQGMK